MVSSCWYCLSSGTWRLYGHHDLLVMKCSNRNHMPVRSFLIWQKRCSLHNVFIKKKKKINLTKWWDVNVYNVEQSSDVPIFYMEFYMKEIVFSLERADQWVKLQHFSKTASSHVRLWLPMTSFTYYFWPFDWLWYSCLHKRVKFKCSIQRSYPTHLICNLSIMSKKAWINVFFYEAF